MKKKAKTADIKFRKQSNAMERTSEKAPYLGKVELKGTVYEDAFIDEMVAQGCTESAASIRRIIHAGDAVTARILGENGQKVQTGDGLVMPHIAGSFPTPDADPGAGNELVPRIDLGDDTRDMLSGVKPTEDRAGIADLGGVRILSVFTEGIGFGQLKGTQPFGIAGVGFKPSASSGAAVKVVNAKTGVETEAAEVTVVDNQNITAQLGEVLPKGQYKVVVKVSDEGGVSGNDEASYNVKMLAAPVPPVAPQFFGDITSTDREGQSVPGKFDPIDHPIVAMGGERLTRDASTSLVFEVKRGGETAFTKDLTDTLDTSLGVEGTLITYLDGQLYELLRSDDDALQNGDIVTATFTNAKGSTTATGEVYNLP